MFNPAITALTAPPVAIVQQWIDGYDGAHGEMIDLSQAVPGYPPHPDMITALVASAGDSGSLSYGDIEGEPVLRQAYADEMTRVYGEAVSADHIIITAGCNQACLTSALTIAGAGDHVLMTEPCYFNHESTLSMLGISTGYVPCHAEDGFIPQLAAIKAAITPRTKALALVSPNNPTGAIYPADHLADILSLCQAAGIWLIVDETYRDFQDPTESRHQLLAHPGRDRLILLYSFSKAYCIPGHRLGAICASPDAVAQMAKIMDNIQICAPRVGQQALAQMIAPLTPWREKNQQKMAARAEAFRQAFFAIDGFEIAAMGAYFGYVQHPISDTSLAVAETIAKTVGVLTIPGDFFGQHQHQHLRFAFANADLEALHALPERLNAL
jgi:aspartate/methionine/tyrosine aminotransferase